MEGYFLTDRGKVRKTNEDAGGLFYNNSNQLLAVVADGMGGHRAGEVASNLAVEFVEAMWRITEHFSTVEEAEKWMLELIDTTNEEVYTHARKNEAHQGMGTTIVAALLTDEFVTVGHVGDSRCYLWKVDSSFIQITSDHSLVNELIKTGQITPSDAEVHPRKNVLTKALGTEEVIKPDIQTVEWGKTDCILLCSDGLSNKVDDEELKTELEQMESIERTATTLLQLANDRGGEDNITLAIVRNEEGEIT
ncbi:MAG TPA: Stp1/IreP family PP2C-type Ser/Thr phosphatase [Pseudogracilibacillus sp.]|nr:Stp1/IreP family PP2C-type Ser/Thr phosphatase [Pseudogracilibacillus sp.]